MDRFEGFREFVNARRATLSRLAYLLTRDRSDAEDLLQHALTVTAARWHRISRYDQPEAFVRTVMYHQAVSAWRRRRRITELPTADLPEPAGPDLTDGMLRRVALERALRQLPPRQRAVLVARFYDDLTEAQAAEALGVSIGTIKSQTHRALSRLRELAPELAEEVRT